MSKLSIIATLADGNKILVKGRDAWTLEQLFIAGEKGCTPIENPAPRWSAYVHNLRNAGLNIETIEETHGGEFKGWHGRYVLRSAITIEKKNVTSLMERMKL